MHIHTIDKNYANLSPMESTLCYNLAMRKATRLINQVYEKHLSSTGLKGGQFSILRAVHILKETNNSQLQGILVLDQTTLSRNLKPLIRDNYLQLTTDDNDNRVKKVSLTSKGHELYQLALPLWQNAQRELENKIGKNTARQVLTISQNFVENFTDS